MTGGTVNDGYQFYLPYTTEVNPDYTPQTLIPAIYAKAIWDNIFWGSSYRYVWDELQDLNFDKMVIPWDGGTFNQFDTIDKEFRVGNSEGEIYNMWVAQSIPTSSNGTAPSSSPSVRLVFDDTDNPIENWYDNDSAYQPDGLIDVYFRPWSQEINIKFFAEVDFTLTNPQNPALVATDIFNEGFFELFIGLQVLARDIYGDVIGTVYSNSNLYRIGSLGQNDVIGNQNYNNPLTNYQVVDSTQFDITFDWSPELVPGTFTLDPRITIGYYPNQSVPFKNYYSSSSGALFNPRLDFNIIAQSDATGHITNKVSNTLTSGSTYYVEDLLSDKIKQTDFVLSVIKMFNLYVTTNPDEPNILIFKTRDNFYDEGEELDWTNKLDIKSVDVELISNQLKRKYLFTHKQDDKDYLLSEYYDNDGEIYGQQEYGFQNQFTTDITKIETIFSPTVTTTNHNNQVPYIDNIKATNTKIVYAGDVIDGQWVYNNGFGNLAGNYFYNYKYRYAGHFFPNQVNPTEDLNWGVCDYYAHNYNSLTNNNLYNRFYRNQMNIFETGHIMTAYFNLSYLDFSRIKMNERIYVGNGSSGAWWNINKVIDFNVNSNELTKVELISADKNIGDFNPTILYKTGKNGYNRMNRALNDGSMAGNTNNTLGRDVANVVILGSHNNIQENTHNSVIAGTYNNVYGENLFVNGLGNVVNGKNISVLGLDGGTYNESNRTYVNTLVKISNVVDAGRDTVLEEYPDNKVINIISAGRDEIRGLGSFSIETNVDGGRDTVL